MKVLGIVCSARKKGNTEILTRAALTGAEEYGATTELIRIADMQIAQCDGCSACHPSGVCKVDDDMQLLLYDHRPGLSSESAGGSPLFI